MPQWLRSWLLKCHSLCWISGKYAFIEASFGDLGDSSNLTSLPLPPSTTENCLSFWYNMYGEHIGSLEVYLKVILKCKLAWYHLFLKIIIRIWLYYQARISLGSESDLESSRKHIKSISFFHTTNSCTYICFCLISLDLYRQFTWSLYIKCNKAFFTDWRARHRVGTRLSFNTPYESHAQINYTSLERRWCTWRHINRWRWLLNRMQQ